MTGGARVLMPYPSSQYSDHPHHHSHPHARSHPRRPQVAQAVAAPTKKVAGAYILAHAGKQVRIGPVVFWIVVGTIVLLGIWSAATATYFTFRDDVLTRLMARQAEMQYAYEDRIADLRARIDRTTSHQMLNQEQFEQRLQDIVRRQAALDARTSALAGLPDASPTGAIGGKAKSRTLTERIFGRAKPSPIDDVGTTVVTPGRQSRLERPNGSSLAEANIDVGKTIAHLESSLDRIEGRQNAVLTSAETRVDSRLQRMKDLIADLGLHHVHLDAPVRRSGVGGPFIPVKLRANASTFDRKLYQISLSRAKADHMTRELAHVPYRQPFSGPLDFSSGFGVRADPFLGRPAMHTGLDIRASTGDPVHATADGKVVRAGWAGGYGRMIEIDHGNGLSTRYGHLSRIDVTVGEHVKIGQVIGEVGSTGRSTGPHLHYETRIDGEAVDPQRFLRAGARFAAG
jgi:murein DD-endopeptidase MepM/ murein hydrolase activator NlpD